jgi:hypothetical protein
LSVPISSAQSHSQPKSVLPSMQGSAKAISFVELFLFFWSFFFQTFSSFAHVQAFHFFPSIFFLIFFITTKFKIQILFALLLLQFK